jgi:Fic family protein
MMTLRQFSKIPDTIPTATSWYLSDLGEARGRQELYTKQAPQRLKVLKEHALIESAVSSNRIEGVNIDPSRVRAIITGKPLLRDRDEEEVRSYRDALNLVHERGSKMPISEKTILELHRVSRGEIWDAGKYKEKDTDIIERQPDGGVRVRFKTVTAKKSAEYISGLAEDWRHCIEEKWVHPLVAMAGFNLDFLCIHPFRDGNGRVSRLLLLLQCYQLGYEVGRYISLERLIEENKDRYYETLEHSSHRWHEGKHDPWHYINFVLYVLKSAYKEFEQRVGDLKTPKGAKTDLLEMAVKKLTGEFTLKHIENACPGVSRDMVRMVLRRLKNEGVVECVGRGPGAKWRKMG